MTTNLDPKPYADIGGETLGTYDPRPEFDVRGNPLLEVFADMVAHNDGAEPVADLAARFLGEHERYVELSSIPERQYAEEVLERIVAASA